MKVYIKTLGCDKNTVDSENIMSLLEDRGASLFHDPAGCDMLIVNTCGFIKDAKEESIDAIFELAAKKKPGSKLVVTGCLAQRYSDELAREIGEIDYILGVNDYPKIKSIAAGLSLPRKNAGSWDREYRELPRKYAGGVSSYIKIAEGCNKACSYCAIPMIRGGYRSRIQENILKEAEMLAKAGVKELILIAQDVTAYGSDFGREEMLPGLLKQLCAIEGLHWIRLMYCYEDEITDSLIKVIKEEAKICKYIDIPVQHGSDAILKAMRRASTCDSIKATVNKLRKHIPDIVIRTTLISGFPGETGEDFRLLCDMVTELKFDRLGVFVYSKEEGTAAAAMKNQVRREVKERRRDKIMALQQGISLENNKKYIGRIMEVLVEEDMGEGAYSGRTAYDAPEIDNGVVFTSPVKLKTGSFVMVKIDDAFDYDLSGGYYEPAQ